LYCDGRAGKKIFENISKLNYLFKIGLLEMNLYSQPKNWLFGGAIMLYIIDYGMGNLGSVGNMLKKVGAQFVITSNPRELEKATKLILPGVGAFDNAMRNLKELGLIDLIKFKVLEERVPILGICLGMQLLTEGSEEGTHEGFGFIKGHALKFHFEDNTLKIPHMGWNEVKLCKNSRLFAGMENQENRFYFVHSYEVECTNKEDILTTTVYGYEFVSSFEKDNILGVQFHPEKSHKFGIMLYKNFVEGYQCLGQESYPYCS